MTALAGVFGGGSRQSGQPERPRRSGLRTGQEGLEPFQGVPMNTPGHFYQLHQQWRAYLLSHSKMKWQELLNISAILTVVTCLQTW